jgi:hypothetical protein
VQRAVVAHDTMIRIKNIMYNPSVGQLLVLSLFPAYVITPSTRVRAHNSMPARYHMSTLKPNQTPR